MTGGPPRAGRGPRLSAAAPGVLRGRALRLAAGVLVATAVAACGIGAPSELPPPSVEPSASQSASAGMEVTRAVVEAALKARELGLIVPSTPFRPPESPALAGASRAVYQVVLSDDPTGGYLVIYEFPDAGTARAAGLTQAAWLASGPGSVNFPPGTTHVIRQVGDTLVTYSYPPVASPDARAAKAADALSTVGLPIPVGP
jgi:predicted small lipoprotein YifL